MKRPDYYDIVDSNSYCFDCGIHFDEHKYINAIEEYCDWLENLCEVRGMLLDEVTGENQIGAEMVRKLKKIGISMMTEAVKDMNPLEVHQYLCRHDADHEGWEK